MTILEEKPWQNPRASSRGNTGGASVIHHDWA